MPARQHRVTRGDDYRRIVRTGNRVGGAFCITYAVSHSHDTEHPGDPARFGYIISKSVGNAVVRNLIRRRMKSVTEEMIHNGIADVDIVFRAIPAAATASFAELKQEMHTSISRLQNRKA